ncbi:MAG: hypothetical protein AAF317_05685 [Pseudomonadota bacterium]
MLAGIDNRGRAMIWLGIGLGFGFGFGFGFGAHDLAALRVGQIAEGAYNMRRGKTGRTRFGTTPPLVWAVVDSYATALKKNAGDLLLTTHNGLPLVHGRSDSVTI